MNKDLVAIFEYLEREKGIKRTIVISAIEESLQAAARKNITGASNVSVTINPKTGGIDVFCEKEIVDDVEVDAQEITIEEARKLDPDCEIGQFIDVIVTPKDFGRIAAQKARQIITQKLRTAERDVIYEEYRHRSNELVSGTVKKFFRGANMIVDLGKVEAVMPMENYPKTERFQVGEKVLALLVGVKETEGGGAEVVLSRSSPEFVRQLMFQEVPEINDGIVTIERIVREAGYRTKMTVSSSDHKVDPVGACVGMRGTRVKNVVRELNNEKVDIIPHSEDAIELLQNALSPMEIRKISISEDENSVSIVVDDDDYGAVIGKRGMNARLNGKLIGLNLEAQRMTDYRRTMSLQRAEIADSDDASLDEPLTSIPGIPNLIFEQLSSDYPTARQLLQSTPEKLSEIPGIGIDMADRILEQITTERIKRLG